MSALGTVPRRYAERERPWRADGGRDPARRRLMGGIGASAVLHLVAVIALVLHRAPQRRSAPPVYRVDLVAAPPGPRSIGTVTPEPPAAAPATPPTPAPTPPRAEAPPPKAKPLPAKTKAKPLPPKSTPVPPPNTKPPKGTTPAKATQATPMPRAGGGPEGGRGADVANVHVAGLDFPFPGYLQNIVRVVAVRFTPPRGSSLTADVSFLVHRDGSVSDVRFVRRSGNYAFDLEAQGAIESAGSARAFGPLPDAFHDDVLPVTFSFDPRVIH